MYALQAMSSGSPLQGMVDKKEDIEMGLASQSILDIAVREFGHFFSSESPCAETIIDGLKAASYFPKKLTKDRVDAKDFLRLCYLATLKSDDGKLPFTEIEVAIFRASKEKAEHTVGWFKKGVVPFLFFSGVTYVSFLTVDDNNNWKTGIAATAGFVSTFALQLLSLWITGTNPNSSKDADNLKQNTIQKVKETYSEMAKELLDLNNHHPKFAKTLAEQIDIQKIFRSAVNCGLDNMETKTVLRQLKDAVLFVRGERALPRCHELRLYVKKAV